MNQDIMKYLEDLKTLNKNIIDAQKIVDLKTEEYKKSILPQEEIINTANSEIEAIRKTEVYAELKDIINEIANEWEITPDQITTKCFVCFVHETGKHQTYPGVTDIKGHYLLNFSISTKQKGLRYTSFSLKTDIYEPQLDGNPLHKFLHDACQGKDSNPKTLTENDIANMVVKLKISEFTKFDGTPKESGCSPQLFTACKLYLKKHPNQTM